ncbi:MAG: RNA polymerase sigma factor [Bacteroidales bacterium]|nr:RNA polymerase sigma factor [Bacteroidales bacterium]
MSIGKKLLGKEQSKYEDDLILVNRAIGGDTKAFEQIVKQYKPMMAKVTIGMVGNREDAEDIGQEAFIRFYRSLHQYKGDASLGTYLTRIAINLSLNELKRRKSNLQVSLETKHESGYSDRRSFQKRDNSELVQEALSHLETKYRSVVVLRLMQGFSTKETAKILKIPSGTVLSRLARGQDRLRQIVKSLESLTPVGGQTIEKSNTLNIEINHD